MISRLIDRILISAPWKEELEESLLKVGFDDPKKSWAHLTVLAKEINFRDLFPDFFPKLLQALSNSYEPESALINFLRFSEKIQDKNHLYTLLCGSENLLQALIVMFSGSQILTDTLLSNPAHFDWLKKTDTLNKPKSKDNLFRDFYAMAEKNFSSDQTPSLLRKFKRREYIRIGLRDLMNLADLKENVRDLSNLADVCLQIAFEHADKTLKIKHGVPMYKKPNGTWAESEFTVIGLGKLGGEELNYSSDIDLIYIYTSSMGQTKQNEQVPTSGMSISNHEYFTRLGQLLTKTIHEITEYGSVFRVDLDLRPEGKSGELVNSLASLEVYYQSWGRTWERQALIKARVSAGSESLGKQFFSMLEPFIFRRNLDFSAIEEIKGMKQKIDYQLKKNKSGEGNIKLGFGGIREVEFIIQAHQLLFGGRHKELRVANTMDALECLWKNGLLKEDEHNCLKNAYVFLRKLENRVQMSFGLQTYSLPKKAKDLAIVARKMGIQEIGQKATIEALKKQFHIHTTYVGNFFANLFVEDKKREETEEISNLWQASAIGEKNFSKDLIRPLPFHDPEKAFEFIKTMRDGPQFYHPSQKCIENFYRLLPKVLETCAQAPRPNGALENLVKFIESSGARETFFQLFIENEKFLELLIILFGSSDHLSQTLLRYPENIDVLLETEQTYRYKQPKEVARKLMNELKQKKTLDEKKNSLRRFKQAEELRIGLRYLTNEVDLAGTLTDLSTLAEIYLQVILETAAEATSLQFDVSQEEIKNFAIIGMGKLGGRELNFGSDLDVVFVYQDKQGTSYRSSNASARYIWLAQTLYGLASEQTSAGYAYKIDCDLRPEGSQAQLAIPLEGFRSYFETRAKVWEQQAITRARFVSGDETLGQDFIKIAHDFAFKTKLKYGSIIEVARLRERMEKELAQEFKKGKDLKKGFGGLADIEFTVQILQLMHGYQTPRLRETNTVDALKALAAAGWLDLIETEQLQKNYFFLRNIECALRIQSRTGASRLPKKKEELDVLAKLLGYEKEDASQKLLSDYNKVTHMIRAFYSKTIDNLLRTSVS